MNEWMDELSALIFGELNQVPCLGRGSFVQHVRMGMAQEILGWVPWGGRGAGRATG